MKYFKRNGFVALVSMLSLTAYAGDSLPLSVAVSETKEFIQVSGHGIDTSNVIQQERIIQGTVLEEGTNEPLVGVNVVVKGTTIGTTTDIDGKYSIKIPSDKAILVFSWKTISPRCAIRQRLMKVNRGSRCSVPCRERGMR